MILFSKILGRREIVIYLSSLFLFSHGQQNLIQNWSFEDKLSCPITGGQINFANYWTDPVAGAGGSSDYYDSCSLWMPTPTNGYGFQFPRHGLAYAGISNFGKYSPGKNASEYIQTKLIQSLQSGKTYCISFFVSFPEQAKATCRSIGIYFSNIQITRSDSMVLRYSPQVYNPIGNYISDTTNWIEINGTVFSNGGENYATIGNFYAIPDTLTVTTDPNVINDPYFYIDDVSVVEVTPAFAGNDTSYCSQDTARIGGIPTFAADYLWTKLSGNAQIDSNEIAQPKIWSANSGTSTFVMQKTQCSVVTYDTVSITFSCVGVKEMNFDNLFSVYPNPASEELIISAKKNIGEFSFELFDIAGREVFSAKKNANAKIIVDVSPLENGIYFLNAEIDNGRQFSSKKIIVQH
jgi:hypothetical protein